MSTYQIASWQRFCSLPAMPYYKASQQFWVHSWKGGRIAHPCPFTIFKYAPFKLCISSLLFPSHLSPIFICLYCSLLDWVCQVKKKKKGDRQPQTNDCYLYSLTQPGQHTGFQIQCSLQFRYDTGKNPHYSRLDTGIHWAHCSLAALGRESNWF